MGLIWALVGAVSGFVAGAVIAVAIAKVTDMTNREGAQGYFMVGLGLIGAIVGIVAALALYGRSAPSGQGAAYAGSGILGLVGLVAVVALSLWAFMNLREAPLEYGGAMADLQMELRFKSTELPTGDVSRWMDIEVHTAKTRPVGTILWDKKRTEGDLTIVPVVQGPLYRSGGRIIVVNVNERQTEAFNPRMKRTPDPKAGWSEWYRPARVDPPYGVVPEKPLSSIFELRYKISVYGQ
jgi:MFS family permease